MANVFRNVERGDHCYGRSNLGRKKHFSELLVMPVEFLRAGHAVEDFLVLLPLKLALSPAEVIMPVTRITEQNCSLKTGSTITAGHRQKNVQGTRYE